MVASRLQTMSMEKKGKKDGIREERGKEKERKKERKKRTGFMSHAIENMLIVPR